MHFAMLSEHGLRPDAGGVAKGSATTPLCRVAAGVEWDLAWEGLLCPQEANQLVEKGHVEL